MTNTPDQTVFLACDVAARKALAVAAKKCKNNRGRASRQMHRGEPDSVLHLLLSPTITRDEVDRYRLLDTAWEALHDSLAGHGLPHVEFVVTACDEYVRNRLVTPARHDSGVLAQFLAEAYAAAT